jgi:hypothetical protein
VWSAVHGGYGSGIINFNWWFVNIKKGNSEFWILILNSAWIKKKQDFRQQISRGLFVGRMQQWIFLILQQRFKRIQIAHKNRGPTNKIKKKLYK